MCAKEVRVCGFKEILAYRLTYLVGNLNEQFFKVMGLHAAGTDHTADNLVVNTIFGSARVRGEVIAYSRAYLVVEGRLVLIAGNVDLQCPLTRLRFTEVDN